MNRKPIKRVTVKTRNPIKNRSDQMIFYAENGRRLSPKSSKSSYPSTLSKRVKQVIINSHTLKPNKTLKKSKTLKSKNTQNPKNLGQEPQIMSMVTSKRGSIRIDSKNSSIKNLKKKNFLPPKKTSKRFEKGYNLAVDAHEKILANAMGIFGYKGSTQSVQNYPQKARPMTGQEHDRRKIPNKRLNRGVGYNKIKKIDEKKVIKSKINYKPKNLVRGLEGPPGGQFSSFSENNIKNFKRENYQSLINSKKTQHDEIDQKLTNASGAQTPMKQIFSNLQIVNSNIYFPMMRTNDSGEIQNNSLSLAPTIQWKTRSKKSLNMRKSNVIRIEGIKKGEKKTKNRKIGEKKIDVGEKFSKKKMKKFSKKEKFDGVGKVAKKGIELDVAKSANLQFLSSNKSKTKKFVAKTPIKNNKLKKKMKISSSKKSKFLEKSEKQELSPAELSILVDDEKLENTSFLLGGRRRESSRRKHSKGYRSLSRTLKQSSLNFKSARKKLNSSKNYLSRYESKKQNLKKMPKIESEHESEDGEDIENIKFEVSSFQSSGKNFEKIPLNLENFKEGLESIGLIRGIEKAIEDSKVDISGRKSKKIMLGKKSKKEKKIRPSFKKKESKNKFKKSKSGKLSLKNKKNILAKKSNLSILRKQIMSASFESSPIRIKKHKKASKRSKKGNMSLLSVTFDANLSQYQTTPKTRKRTIKSAKKDKQIGSLLDRTKRDNFEKEMKTLSNSNTLEVVKSMNSVPASVRLNKTKRDHPIAEKQIEPEKAQSVRYGSTNNPKTYEKLNRSLTSSNKMSFKSKFKKVKIPKFSNFYYMTKMISSLHLLQSTSSTSSMSQTNQEARFHKHFIQSTQSVIYIKTIKKPTFDDLLVQQVYLPPLNNKKKTLIFDLDETLIHCNEDPEAPCDIRVPIKFSEGEVVEAGLIIRPFAKECLRILADHFQVVVFTASHSCYANIVLNILDPKNQYIAARLYRENCFKTKDGIFIKDLRVFANRDQKDLLIVDNAFYSYGLNLFNGVPILPFYDDKEDNELEELTEFLIKIKDYDDFRPLIQKIFMADLFDKYSKRPELLARLIEKNYLKVVQG